LAYKQKGSGLMVRSVIVMGLSS